MIGSGPWVRGAGYADGLVFPGWPRAEAADLHLGPAGVKAVRREIEVLLRWEDHELAAVPAPGRWNVGPCSGPLSGVSLVGDVRLDVLRTPLGISSSPFGRYAVRLGTVPLFARRSTHGLNQGLIDQTAALLAAIAARPGWQERLADQERVLALCRALQRTTRTTWAPRGIDRRVPAQVARALRRQGFVHPLGGRPATIDDVEPEARVLPAVIGELRRHPDADIAELPEEAIADHVRRQYLAVEPWPFAALA